MTRTIMLIPTRTKVDLNSISLGISYAMERTGIHCNIFKPISQLQSDGDDTSTTFHENSELSVPKSLKMSYVESLLSNNQKDILMEKIIANYHNIKNNKEVILVEGLVPTCEHYFIQLLNYDIAKTLNAEIIFVMPNVYWLEQLKENIKLIQSSFEDTNTTNIIGVIITELTTSLIDKQDYPSLNLFKNYDDSNKTKKINPIKVQDYSPLPVLGVVQSNKELISIRAVDIAQYLNAVIINNDNIYTRRIKSLTLCAYSVSHMLKHLHTGSLLITSADRHDVLIAATLAAINGMEIGAILLTDGYIMDTEISKLCERAFATSGLPVFMVSTNIWETALSLNNFSFKLSYSDDEYIKKIQEYVANNINVNWINSLTSVSRYNRQLSPPAFRYQLTELAKKANKRIVLPEGTEPRIVKAAAICAERNIATCILLGDQNKISLIATSQGINLNNNIKIIDPNLIRKKYVSRLIQLRKNKGMTESIANEQLKDNVVVGTLMLEQNEVDGLVSGVAHTTANTIRPSLQLIKTAPGNSLVSSIFFMLLPEQVYVYGDCAINPNPTAEQLAEIAIQSADSAAAFNIEPRVAMLSYSTGTSGTGSDVEKIRKATHIAQNKRPNLIIDGPLQYDAAVMSDVAKIKAPASLVAGQATVFIFPDLNAGNIAYKAVQRTANLISIGPILQGMCKPVNDLSRGAMVYDIVYTIAITAIQAT